MADKKKLEQATSPKGRLKFPRINGTPDTKFDADGVWKTNLIVPAADAQKLVDKIRALQAAEVAKAKAENKGKKIKEADLPFVENEEDGTIEFKFKAKASGKKKADGQPWSFTPPVFGSDLIPLPGDTKVGGGSTARVAFEFNPFYVAAVGAGVGLRLKAVQIVKLVEWGNDASSFGFGKEDDEDDTGSDVSGETESAETDNGDASDF